MRALKITNNITRRDEKSLEKYFTEISAHEVLSPEEEYALFDRLAAGEDVLHNIVNANLRFVVSVAKQYQNLGLSLSDLINEGNVGLIKAAKRFDTTRGFKFISYAVWWIRQAILQAISEKGRKIRVPANVQSRTSKVMDARVAFLQKNEREPTLAELAQLTETTPASVKKCLQFYKKCSSLDAPLSSDSDADAYAVMKDEETAAPDKKVAYDESLAIRVREMLASLPVKEATVLKHYFGIGQQRSMTYSDIADSLGLSRERIRQLQNRGIRRLRRDFKDSIELLAV